MRFSYENDRLYLGHEISPRPSFYYRTPLFTSSPLERKMDYLLGLNFEIKYKKRE